MRYLSEDQVTQMMGIGYLGEVRQGPDGNLYQYVQGVDGLGQSYRRHMEQGKALDSQGSAKGAALRPAVCAFDPRRWAGRVGADIGDTGCTGDGAGDDAHFTGRSTNGHADTSNGAGRDRHCRLGSGRSVPGARWHPVPAGPGIG